MVRKGSKTVIKFLCLLILSSVLIAAGTATAAAIDWWPMFQHDQAHTGTTSSAVPLTNQTLWVKTLSNAVRSGCAVLDGVVYVGCFGGNVYALNAYTGATIWTFSAADSVWGTIAVADGKLFFGSNDGYIYCLDAGTGKEVWNMSTSGQGDWSSATVVNNIVYIGSCDDNIYALDAATGTIVWNYTTGNQVRGSPVVSNGAVYDLSEDENIYALNATTGAKLWSAPTGNKGTYTDSSPTIANGVVYVGSTDDNVYAFNAATGAKLWNYATGGPVSSTPVVISGVLYIGSADSNVYALDANSGSKIWSYPTGGAVYAPPIVVGNIAFIGAYSGTNQVLALDASTGAKVWSYTTGGQVFAQAVIANGVLYIGSYDSNLYAFGNQAELLSNSTSTPTGTAKATYAGSFTFRAWIDGTDYVYIQGGEGTVWYQHTKSEIPGYEINGAGVQGNIQRHQNLPTYIDGNAWYPTWAGITTSWIDVPAVSDKYINPAPHPTGEWNITSITDVVARGNFSVVEYPSASNNYTAKILLDDILPPGAEWYSFTMNWITNNPLTQQTSDVTKTAWVPPPANGAAASIVTVGAISVVALLAAAASSVPPAATTGFLDKLVSELRKLLPDTVKKWMEDFIASKRKLRIEEKTGSKYLPTKPEIIVYSIAIVLLTLSFSYVKVTNLNELLIVLPAFFATSIVVALVRTYVLTLYARKQGVWTEYKLWYFGVAMFLLSTLAFKAPFSSPTRTVHHSHNFTERLGGFLSTAGLLITLAFAGFFFILLKGGLVLIGGTGLAMCIISAFFDTFPIEPMGGRDIYKYNKKLWAVLFLGTLVLYATWIAHVF